jgi:ABC-2 type transport system ATP-binding protein
MALLAQHGDEVRDLEVRRASLEDAYLALVRTRGGEEADAGSERVLTVVR